MKIVIDATALLDQYSKRGIGTYTKGILHELLKNKDHEWHILGFLERKDNFSAIGMDPTKHSNVFFHSLGPVRKSNLMNFFYSDKTIKTLLSKIQPDMFFSPNFERGVWTGKWKKIVMIHDIIPVTNNSFSQKGVFFNFFKKIFYLDRLKKALNSDLILTNSEFSKGMIARNFKVDPKKIIPIPLAIDNNLKTNPERLSKIKLESYGIRNNYLLYYGGLEQNKNIEYLLKVFSLLSKEITDISLVIVSSEFLKKSRKETIANTKTAQKLLDSAKKLAIFEKVVFTQVLDDDLPLVLKNSKAFIHLSRQEGFGLSVLEAISMGVPCIVSDIPVYREFFEDGVKFVPLNDTEQTSQTILRLLKFDNDLVKLAEKGKKISEKFGWITTANLTMQAIQNLSEGKFNQKPIDKNSVTFISPYFFPYKGGVENYTFDIARRLVDNGFCVDVLTSKFEKKQKKFQDIRGIKVHRFQTFINQYYLRFYPGLLFHLFRSRSQIFHVQGIGFIWQDFCLLIKKWDE